VAGKACKAAILALAGIAAVIQFVRPDRSNPASDPAASFEAVAHPAPRAAAALRRACMDCHSNSTVWPWYSGIAPVSWLVARDVNEGRAHLNLSEWSNLAPEMSELRRKAMCAQVREGEMPLLQYRLIHSGARLSAEDVSALCAGIGPADVVE
jgi:hypothetical protein